MGRLRNLFDKFRPRRDRGAPAAASEGGARWIVVGLGNPGEQYARSRHNAGFRVVEALARSNAAAFDRRKFKGRIAEIRIGSEPVLLVKPETFYNLSGECVAAMTGYFKVPGSRLIVVHDDLDLEVGRLRLKLGGGDAGNRGVRSIADSLGTTDFVRVRVGIGRPVGDENSKDYVLKPMNARENEKLADAIARAAAAVEAIATGGLERAMERYNQRV